MNDDKWYEVLDRVKDKFTVLESGKNPLDPGPGEIEFVVFNGPMGKIKLERESKPRVLDTKGLSSKRIGSKATIAYTYSDTEKVQTFSVYVWEESAADWKKLDKFSSDFL